MQEHPQRIINSLAPIRICDNGGWTDTWFAGHGKVFNIAVTPYVEVQVAVFPRTAASQAGPITIYAENYGERWVKSATAGCWERHPLLEAAIERMRVPSNVAIQVTIFSDAPGGASTGTSAAVTVALVGALDRLTPGRLTAHEIAQTAHAIETEMLGQQSGIQDQLAAAYGGVNYIEMFNYPHASVSPLNLPADTWVELERRLALIFLGKTHNSSAVHLKVIHDLEDAGPNSPAIIELRAMAERSRDALYAGDFAALGKAMADNTEAQRRLNPTLVSVDAQRVIDIARRHGALGWKVNGAGGDGGSVTILCGDLSPVKRTMQREIEQENRLYRAIPIRLSRDGVRVWEVNRQQG